MFKRIGRGLVFVGVAGVVMGSAGVANADTGSSSADPLGDTISYYTDSSVWVGARWSDVSHVDRSQIVSSTYDMWGGGPYVLYKGTVLYFEKRVVCQAEKFRYETGVQGIPFMRTCDFDPAQNGWHYTT